MGAAMKFMITALAAVVLSLSSGACAQEAASPITGLVPDPINLVTTFHSGTDEASDQSPLFISFCDPETKFFRYHLHLNEDTICTAPTRLLKLSGGKAENIKIEPEIPGEWRYNGDYGLRFTPSRPWRAGTDYVVTFPKGLYPAPVVLHDAEYRFTTTPLYAISRNLKYLQDNADPSKKLVSARIDFNYPVDRASLKSGVTFSLESAKGTLPYSVDFADNDSQANITVPVAALSKDAQFMGMEMHETIHTADGSGVLTRRPIVYKNNEEKQVHEDFRERVTLPSLYDYLAIKSTDAKVVKNAHYVPQQLIVLESNAFIAPADLVRFTDIQLLPEDKPIEGLSPRKHYGWSSPSEITPAVKTSLTPLNFAAQEPDADASPVNALAVNAQGGRYALVTVKKGLPAKGGYELGHDYQQVVQIPHLPQEVKVMAEGSLLSLSGEKTLSVLSLGFKKLDYRIGRVKEENLAHLISQTRGEFSHPEFVESYQFNENNISEISDDSRVIAGGDPKKPDYSSFDFTPYLAKDNGGKGLFFLTVSGKNDEEKKAADPVRIGRHHYHHAETAESVSDSRFILVTDLGIIVKKNNDGSRDVFVQSIGQGGPVAGVMVDVLGLNGTPVAHAETDRDGHASIANLDSFANEKKPVAFVARKDGDLSFLPYERYDRELNYSKFDIEGLRATEGLNAYLFSDRGVYRPGETAHLGLIVKSQNASAPLTGLPLILETTNPQGRVVDRQTLALTAEGLMEATIPTSESGITGIYNATLYLGRDGSEKGVELGSLPIRVEDFLPDRMKISSVFQQAGKPVDGLGWVKPSQITADVTLMQLYGAPATGRRVTGKMTLAPGYFAFGTYRDYSFIAGNTPNKSFDETLAETKTDASGKAHFTLPLDKYAGSSFRLTFLGEGFEPDSGRSVKTSKSILVSPLDYVLGVRTDGNFSYINPGDARSVSLIAVGPNLAKVAASDLTLEIKRAKTIQSLTKSRSGEYSYQSTTVESTISSAPFTVAAGGSSYALPTKDSGSYVLVWKNAGGIVLARVPYTVIGENNASAGFTRDATMQVTTDKPTYKSGDDISLNIQSPYTGTGLITLETDHVLAWQWFTTDSTSSTQSIRIPKDFEGKGFINVQFTRDVKSKAIFMSPLSFSVLPFTAGIAERDQQVTLTVPKDVRPGDSVSVSYRTKKPGKIIVYAVDEGILLYAHYQNPNPIEHFFLKRALEVSTSQIMDLLLPEYSLLKSLSEAGGDGFANDGKNLNPFKRKTEPPVAYWSGVLDSGPEAKNWNFTVPPYFNGGVRILAVGVSTDTMGMNTTATSVHGPLIVTPNLPLFAAPGDHFTATATIANHVTGSGPGARVTLAIEPSEQLQIVDAPAAPLALAENAEITVPVTLKATDRLGSGSLRFTASLGTEHFTISQTLSVRPPLPHVTLLKSGFAKDKTANVTTLPLFYPQLTESRASASSLPVSLIGGLRDYLASYPYGCVEQMTSQTFPNVVLYGNAELIRTFGWNAEKMQSAIVSNFNALRERQSESGGFGMWSFTSEPSGFLSTYVFHYLLEAKEKNLPVPQDVYENDLRYLKNFANEMPHTLEDARERAYAIYLLTRAGEITANYIPHLLEYLDANHAGSWHNDLTAIYLAATYSQMQMEPEAKTLLDQFHLETPVLYTTTWFDYPFYDSLTRYSQYVYLIARHFPLQLAKMDKAVIYRVANFVGEGSYDTLSSSYAIMALNAYLNASKDTLAHLSIEATGADGKALALGLSGERIRAGVTDAPLKTLRFTADAPGFFYQVASSGYERNLPDKPLALGLELERLYLGAGGKPVTSVKLGDTVDVVFRLRAGHDQALSNIAIVDLLPGGFELEPAAKPASKPAKIEDGDSDATTPATDADTSAALPYWQPESIDRREDRMIVYGVFTPDVRTWRYRIKATSRGIFVTPPAYAESMYDPTLKVRGLAGSITVQ